MHESADGAVVLDASGPLLRGISPSDVCLSCHGSGEHAVFGFDPMTPSPELGGGNFAFLFEDQINDDRRSSAPVVTGDHAGHSIVAPAHGLYADTDHSTAPGGGFPSGQLGCTSCHDPHGNANFRMLHGAGPVQDGLFQFVYGAPDAEGLPLGLPGVAEAPGAHTAYRSGMSNWCANCHGQYHDQTGMSDFQHGFDLMLGSDVSQRYNEYDGEASPTGGDPLTAYLNQVPFEDAANSIGRTSGPSADGRVMCLTCHRAHATSAPAAARWDMRVHELGIDGVASGSLPLPNPYPDPGQRQLCNKCHDERHGAQSRQSCYECHRK